ncbi:disease resistance protein Roq1-like [Gastrolobium bilobum]|uniref:disease resistance protein Roq1-like n=1 Tax=Gastrolobium bilobum TaxID=150636 RepID=UPI002AAFEC56|nr:disease resistance protein Roq1-like [Gastrolobium bilobum]XP_061352137.1 disease resistance protein Roq1-like [Gastrolobium bilobum]
MTQQTLPHPSSFTCECTYDVFLNFRGVDTRHNFTGNLYNSLHERGIHTFFDDERLNKGEEITPSLFQGIQDSRIFIAVLSKNYASSTYCLDELVMILECSKAQGRLFWPVFYDVDPSQVRHQSGTYAEALAILEERFKDDKEKVKKWREALCQAANMSGSHFQHGSQSEYQFIKKIVEEVSKKIDRTPLYIAAKTVALESRVLEVTSLLGLGSDKGVNMVGIHGIGGIGKSTLARAVYNLIADQFEGCCFLANIRERAINNDGLVQLQKALLSELLGVKDIEVGDVYSGIPIIKRRLRQKKVLLILDDVDKLKQLEVIAGGCDWFGSGSRIIITTRDKHLLATHGIVKSYEVKQLSDDKALELFSWHAFKKNKIDPIYVDISKSAVSYARGLPLALEMIGSHLFGKSLEVWKSALEKYKRTAHKDIHKTLKISYDDLEDDEKGIFLDIACFFNSYEISYVKEILYLHGFHAENGIQVLTDKSLIKIDLNGFVRMHDLIQDMGREIIRQESTLEPGRCSRLWFNEDIVHVLENDTGTDTIEAIIINLWNDQEVQWSGKAFEKMKNLRILIIRDARFSRGPQNLPNSLRVLDWSGYPSLSLPSDFNPKNLVILSLPESCLRSFKPLKVFQSLNFMDFEGCKFLTELPRLSGVPNLGALCLDNCTNLIRIDGSVGFLERLVSLSARGCTRLEILVPSINLTSLETLDLSGCSCLDSFPEVFGVMENIRDVNLDKTAIDELPFSIGNLVGLQRLFLRECQGLFYLPSSIHRLSKLEVITAYGRRGFRLSEDKEKVSSKVFPNAMLVNYQGNRCWFCLDVYYLNISPNNVIEVGRPSLIPSVQIDGLLVPHSLWAKTVKGEWASYYGRFTSNGTRMCFWFRNKFPKIGVCCARQPGTYEDNMVLDFKLSVVINGTKQFSSSCNYVVSRRGMRDIMLSCDLQSKAESVFSEHEWNKETTRRISNLHKGMSRDAENKGKAVRFVLLLQCRICIIL